MFDQSSYSTQGLTHEEVDYCYANVQGEIQCENTRPSYINITSYQSGGGAVNSDVYVNPLAYSDPTTAAMLAEPANVPANTDDGHGRIGGDIEQGVRITRKAK